MSTPSNDRKKGNDLLETLLFGAALIFGPRRKARGPRVPAAKLEELYPEETFEELPPPKLRRTEFHIRKGWGQPKPESLPAPTYAPAGMAMGVVFIAFGLISKWYLVWIGLVIAVISMWHWVRELADD